MKNYDEEFKNLTFEEVEAKYDELRNERALRIKEISEKYGITASSDSSIKAKAISEINEICNEYHEPIMALFLRMKAIAIAE